MIRLATGVFGSSCLRCVEHASKSAVQTGSRQVQQRGVSVMRPRAIPFTHGHAKPNNNPCTNIVKANPTTQLYISRNFSALRQISIGKGLHRPVLPPGTGHRSMSALSAVGRVFGRFLKIRYLAITSAIGGGVAVNQKYESWKDGLPDFGRLSDLVPKSEKFEDFGAELKKLTKNLKNLSLPEIPRPKGILQRELPSMGQIREWLDKASEQDPNLFIEGSYGLLGIGGAEPDSGNSIIAAGISPILGMSTSSGGNPQEKERMTQMQEEMVEVQIKYQKEIERLEKENRELRRQILLKDKKDGKKTRKMKSSLIDMYSEVLDELSDYDSSYNTQDHLPRVVVVGDQSSGKTSVLEMIAQARIFPRGSGEMMTRSPVKVTLSEGAYHTANFKDSGREYDLTKESELEALRREIEVRMKASVAGSQTVSGETIALTVRGPGIQRMVLVDLPGIISTVTTGMATDTRDRIQRICKQHMENPNAIILCIQDGSLDAERSNVTDLVSTMDPQGKRTIFVLTKVDLAEKQLYNPKRIQQILEGRLFPMKALGYFAVVTGKGNTGDSIADIKNYEDDFFKNSKLFREGALKAHQMTTQNLSFAVSECFWKMVKGSAEQQADAFKATRFNLETEWKNTFPRTRELDREELFEKARGEILDEIINLSQVTPQQWEEAFGAKLWGNMSDHVFEEVYLPASQADNVGIFNTAVDIKLKQWADRELPRKCVTVGWETLRDEFGKMLERNKDMHGHDDIFDLLKGAVKDKSMDSHKWDEKAEESLRVIQMNTLEDRSVHDKYQWDQAVKFMEQTVKKRLEETEKKVQELEGPGTRAQWIYWQKKTPAQKNRCATLKELDRLLQSDAKHKPQLTFDELTTVRKNLETQGVDVENEFINESWKPLYRKHFLSRSLSTCNECRKGFYYYQRGFKDAGLECNDVVLFWRIQRMLQVTCNALRQQVINNEARRLERNIKEALEEYADDKDKLQQLLTGKRVLLAEELKRVRQVQELLEEFVQALKQEKS